VHRFRVIRVNLEMSDAIHGQHLTAVTAICQSDACATSQAVSSLVTCRILCYESSRVKSLTEYLWFEVPGRRGFINITPKIEELVSQSGVREGLCLVNAMHITASVFINDDESGLHHDYEIWLEKLAPHAPSNAYRHNRTGEDNADAHLKRQIMGREVIVAITKGKLDLGPWEQIFYGEFDGRRRKRALVKIIGQ
jgi:secondary thiamine-phosphate synthase enzyme